MTTSNELWSVGRGGAAVPPQVKPFWSSSRHGGAVLSLPHLASEAQPLLELLCRHWPAAQETLHLGASLGYNPVELLAGLHAFGRGCHSHALRKRRHGAHNIERVGIFRDVLDEGSVDLDLVERKTLKIGQRGITGAKIVHGDPNA